MSNVHILPGVDTLEAIPGQPRPDIADSLRRLADMADRGEIESVVLVAIGPGCGVFDMISTPELNFYEILGALEALKPLIMGRRLVRNPPDPTEAA